MPTWLRKLLIIVALFAVMFAGVMAVDYAHGARADVSTVEVIGHAGGKGIAPENTVEGMQKTYDVTGVDTVEVDVRWSKTNTTIGAGFPVLMHDDTLDKTTNGTGPVVNQGVTALTNLYAQDYAPWNTDPEYVNTKVPYAYNFFSKATENGGNLLLDVKVTPDQANMNKLIEYADMFTGGRDRMYYMGSASNVDTVNNWYPALKYVVIEYPPTGRIYTGEYLDSLGVYAYALPDSRIPTDAAQAKALVDYYHSYGLKFYTWTSDTDLNASFDEARWTFLATAGFDAIITNRAADALAELSP